MSQKTIIIAVAIFLVLGIALFAIGFYLLPKDKVVLEEQPAKNLFPFGTAEDRQIRNSALSREETGIEDDKDATEIISGILKQLSNVPIAGAITLEKDGKTFVRYTERTTGHVYETSTDGRQKNRLSNTTIPAIQQVLWGADGEDLIIRYLDENDVIKSVVATIVKGEESQTGVIEGALLPDNIHDLTVSHDGQNIFYILSLGNAAIGTTANIDGSGKKQIFESPVVEWQPTWITKNNILLTTKPSYAALGYLYTIQISSGVLNKILGSIAGLTTRTSNDMSKTLYSASGNNTFETSLHDIESGTSVLFPITTLPEKCVWGSDNITLYCGAPQVIPKANYPDTWYKGVVSFNDAIWKINTETGVLNILSVPEEDARESID
ncbi:hypothetical protein CL630_01690, partial [bacterium]|nr:hypothetical protein [bacterium]